MNAWSVETLLIRTELVINIKLGRLFLNVPKSIIPIATKPTLVRTFNRTLIKCPNMSLSFFLPDR